MLTELKNRVARQNEQSGGSRKIELSDSTFRDAHQCLWSTRMTTEQMLPVAKMLDSAGFDTLECMGLVQYDGCVLFLNQNPLERLKLLRQRIVNTPIRVAVRSNMLRGFSPVAYDATELFIERQVANGARDIAFLESMHDWNVIAPGIQKAKALGASTSVLILYNQAPGYDDDYYERISREVVERFCVDRIYFADAGGTLTLQRLRTLIPVIRSAIGDTTLEFNTHCLTGLGPLLALEAAVLGADVIFTAVEPLSDGPSVPGSQMVTRNLRELGFDVRVDDRSLERVGEYLGAVAEREGLPVGTAAEYDPHQYETQFAGGALANMVSQLEAAGIAERLPEVLEEIARVRQELGSPVMATPFPAIVAAQAVMNVVQGERYRVVPDEVKKYICGYFGEIRIPIDPDIVDRIISNGSSDISLKPPEPEPIVPALRRQYPDMDDDELLLRYMYGDGKIDGLSPVTVDDGFSLNHSIVELLQNMTKIRHRGRIHLSNNNYSVTAG